MLQLIFHGIGDYLTQNDWMDLNKKKRTSEGMAACLCHCLLYTIPFLFIGSFSACWVIFWSHFFIDKFHFVDYFLAIRNNVKKQVLTDSISGTTKFVYDISNFGFSLDRPFAISIWLYIITDNLFHIICNYLALRYL